MLFCSLHPKSETAKLLRQAMKGYKNKKFIEKADNIMLSEESSTVVTRGIIARHAAKYNIFTAHGGFVPKP